MSKTGSESQLRSQLEAISKERYDLQLNLEALERENKELKKTVYELSYLLSTQNNSKSKVFSVDGPERSLCGPGHSSSPFRSPEHDYSNIDRRLLPEGKLVGHTGAVYATVFSPCGNLVASGGFDRSVRLWDSAYPFSQVACLAEHRQLVSDICWSPDARSLLSCSFDQSIALWDAETGQRVNNILCLEGLLQCVRFGGNGYDQDASALEFSPLAYAGSTSQRLYTLDLRDPLQVVNSWKTEAHINSMHVFGDGTKIITGDSLGALITWDARIGRELELTRLEAPTPISHVLAAPPDAGRSHEEGRIFAANCYDNTLRVYYRENSCSLPSSSPSNLNSTSSLNLKDQGESTGVQICSERVKPEGVSSSSSRTSRGESVSTASTSASMSPSRILQPLKDQRGIAALVNINSYPSLYQLQTFRGHTVKNWPIRAAVFKGLQHRTPRMRRGRLELGGSGGGRRGLLEGISGGLGYEDAGKDWGHSLVLATGSADGNIYTFDLSKYEGTDLQVLHGHSDRVYSVHFHPSQPRMVSGSADMTVRVWGPSKTNRRSTLMHN